MNDGPPQTQPRILIIDDNAAIHNDFRKILGSQNAGGTQLDTLEQELFGAPDKKADRAAFRIDSALQGQEAFTLVQRAVQESDPYVLAFVDIRMPPGWDGVETLDHLWQCSPELQAVLCTAHSDYSWDDIVRRLVQADSLLILKKPFDTAEVLQIAHALTRKWELARQAHLRLIDLERMVFERTRKLREEVEERARIQEALRTSEDRFSKAFQNCPIPMSIQSHPDARFLDANPAFLDLTGYPRNDLLQRTGAELRLWEDGAAPVQAEADPYLRVRNRPSTVRRSDGSSRNTIVWAEPITLQTGPCLLLILEDVTDRVRLEAQLRQSQKLEAVGCLAAGVAHEFNNLLTVIQGHSGLLRTRIADSDPSAESVDRIAQASQRAASLTRRLLAFSHKQPLQFKAVNLSLFIQGLSRTLSQILGERFQLQLDCVPDLPVTRADEGNLEQILFNLTLNARDAMRDGGILRVATSLVHLDDASASQNVDARAGQFIRLIVSDTGCGMSPEVLNRVFDPFYTTKEVGKGTGLGLSTVHGIVKQHEGWIEVSSRLGHGTRFDIFLPVWDQPAAPAQPKASSKPTPYPVTGETVLIVEDESIVREAARLALEGGGYRVFEAPDGPSALALWERSPVRIDLLVTDMVMPRGVSGAALARTLQARDPKLRALYISGYSSEVVKEELNLTLGAHFLRKPYDPPALLDAVRLCLGASVQRQGQLEGSPLPGEPCPLAAT